MGKRGPKPAEHGSLVRERVSPRKKPNTSYQVKRYGLHNHPPQFGMKRKDCPRCSELEAHPERVSPSGFTQYREDSPISPVALEFLRLIEQGAPPRAARAAVGITEKTLWSWRNHPEFLRRYKDLRGRIRAKDNLKGIELMPLERFRLWVFNRKTYAHMHLWQAWMEEPESSHILIVTPPACGKTTFLTDYITYRIAQNPQIRIAYISLAERHAAKQLQRIKGVIEENTHLRDIAGDLRPGPGDPHPWAATHFMVRGRGFTRGEDEADFTLRGFGMSSQIVGSRLDLAIVDDPDQEGLGDTQREDIFERLMMNVESRLNVGGKMIVILNRWGHRDVASRIMAQEAETPGLWRIYTTPAIIRKPTFEASYDSKIGAKARDWGEVIWPEKFGTKTGNPGDPWTRKRAYNYFADKRLRLGPRRFAVQYQNNPSEDDTADFTSEMVAAAKERGRVYTRGQVPADAVVVCAQDPAVVEGCATLAYAIRPNGERIVVDYTWDKALRERIYERISEFNRYNPIYWAIEAQGPWKAYAESPEVRDLMLPTCGLETFTTLRDAYAGDTQVASIIPMFAGKLAIPSARPEDNDWSRELERQFLLYRPPEVNERGQRVKSNIPYDIVMAVWLAERVIARKKVLDWIGAQAEDEVVWQNPYNSTWTGGGFASIVG